MPDTLFGSVIDTSIDAKSFLICTAASILLGLLAAAVHMFRNNYSRSMVVSLALLPFVVQCVIMMVNGNIGAGVAVAGAFSLVRFRSAQGTAREIAAVFLAMAIGLSTGMGYIAVALLLALISSAILFICTLAKFGSEKPDTRILRVTFPDNIDFTTAFSGVFAKYLSGSELIKYKTTNLGSLFVVTYRITLKKGINEKQFIDELRCLNGNLDIACMMRPDEQEML